MLKKSAWIINLVGEEVSRTAYGNSDAHEVDVVLLTPETVSLA